MTASIFNSTDNSLSARIKAWREVYRANEQLQASLKLDDGVWLDRLGEQEDRLEAKKVITNSYQQATTSLTEEDLQTALETDLISKQDYRNIMIAKRTQQSKHQSQNLAKRKIQRTR